MNQIVQTPSILTEGLSVAEAPLVLATRIYCGRDIPRDRRVDLGSCTSRYTEITDAGVTRFIREVVGKVFPDGFTILRSEGGWRDTATGEVINERGFVVEVIHGQGDLGKVRDVALEWKRWAQQQAVMVTTEPRRVAFL